MISRVRGRVVSAHPRCVVEVGGMGFEVAIPEKDREALAPTDAEVVFHTHLVVREDRLSLFGFLQRDDRELFLRLIDVSGVGPKLALAVLSLHPAARVVTAIKKGDSVFLSKIPGIGKKTAERLLLELRDRLGGGVAPSASGSAASVRGDVLNALSALGYSDKEAGAALARVSPEAAVPEAIRQALKMLSKT